MTTPEQDPLVADLVDAAKRAIFMHDNGTMPTLQGDSVSIERMRAAVEALAERDVYRNSSR